MRFKRVRLVTACGCRRMFRSKGAAVCPVIEVPIVTGEKLKFGVVSPLKYTTRRFKLAEVLSDGTAVYREDVS